MSKRRLLRWSLILVILAAFAVWLEPTRVAWGWLRGEAFYQGRPTSWWERELARWEMHKLHLGGRAIVYYERSKNNPFEWLRACFTHNERTEIDFRIPHESNLNTKGPTLLHGDPDADQVLRVLAQHPVEPIRRLANQGLQMIELKQKTDETP
jgi:hypothetical protein